MEEKSTSTTTFGQRQARASANATTRRKPKAENSLRGDLKQFTRQRILDAALECFRHGSFRSTTVDQIVEVAGMTVPTFYRYFSSKDALIPALQDHLVCEVQQVLSELDDVDVADRLAVRRWFDGYIVMWSRVHRLCDAYWEANVLDGPYAKDVWSNTLDTVAVMKNIQGRLDSDAQKRFEARLGLMALFMDRAALMVVAEQSSTRAALIRDEFATILWQVLNNFAPPEPKRTRAKEARAKPAA